MAEQHPFAVPDFRWFWAARLCTVLAQSSSVVVIGWQVYDIARASMDPKHAALQLGFVGLVQFAPLFVLTLVTGWVADRIDRRLIVRACVAVQLLCVAALGVLTALDRIPLMPLFAVAAMLGVVRAFYAPAQNALAPNLVPRRLLPRAIAMNAIASRVGAILGPVVGGYLYALAPHAPYAANAVLFGIALACMMLIRPPAPYTLARRKPWVLMVEGLRYIAHNRFLLGAISLDLFAVLLGGATAMLPIYARDILHVGPPGLGYLRSAGALGALLTATWLSYRPLRGHVGATLFAGVAVFGAATVGFGLSRTMPLSLLFLTTLGAADMLSVYIRQSLVQISTPDEMRGRVGAVSTMFVSASNELGEAESGFLAAATGPVAAVVVGGLGAMIVAVLWSRWFPMLRNADSFDLPEKPAR